MDTAKFQELLQDLKTGPVPEDTGDDIDLPEGFPDPEEMLKEGADPQFVMYTTLQMQMMAMATMLEQSGIVDEYHQAFEAAMDQYMPGYPPESPVTDSYFYTWMLYDFRFGKERQNIGQIVTEMLTEMGMPKDIQAVSQVVLASRMGIYETIDTSGDLLVVRELVTNRELLVDAPTGFYGAEGMLRFVRLGPPTVEGAEYFTELTTPYILRDRSTEDWTRYLQSVMPATVVTDDGVESTQLEDRLASVFKDDLGVLPWAEFIYQGYQGYDPDVIFLTGIPDDPDSLPHRPGAAPAHSLTVSSNRDLSPEIEIALTDAQRQAAAELMPQLESTFQPTKKGKKKIVLPVDDWSELSRLASVRLTREFGRGCTRLRNLRTAIDTTIDTTMASAHVRKVAETTPPSAVSVQTDKVYTLRIDLQGLKPPIWRRIEVPDCSLAQLHYIVQAAMGWTNSHMHDFLIKEKRYSLPNPFDDFGLETLDSTAVRLSDVVRRAGTKFEYMYDFGDSWEHSIKVEAIGKPEASVRYPRCVKGKLACPPEDCGGIWGYADLCEILEDPNHPEYEERIEWCGEFDPDEFNADECTEQMQAWYTASSQQDSAESNQRLDRFDINENFFEDDEELDFDRFEQWSQQLLDEFAASPEFKNLVDDEYGITDNILQFAANYLGIMPTEMSLVDLEEILFEIVPRKVMLEPEAAQWAVRELNAFFRFLKREYSIAGAEKLADAMNDQAAERLADELGDDSNFGMAKSFVGMGQAAGFDMTSEEGLAQFMATYNRNLATSDELPGSDNPGLADAPLATPTIRLESPKPGRNDPCPCGSGKKYKKCCLK